ncbi:alpha-galactosidase [Streptococcus equi subsp. zooepidemicus SzAM35]|nr:alpha-galactosidase [Streptococcus equi subsp. zooepidemicus SzAM35]
MQLYLGAGYAHSAAQGGMSSYQFKNTYNLTNELEALELWFKIWDKYKASHQGIQLKMAIAVALEFTKPVGAWYNESQKIDPLERFVTFAEAEQGNVLFEDFYSLTVEQIRNVVNAKITDEDMKWLRQYVETNKPAMINRNDITKGYSLISYVGTNPETGVSVHSSGFYGPNPTIKEVIKYGGVCGAMSKLSSVLAQAYGVPAFPIGQPGHCAYIYLNADHTYQLGYDVSGWTGCGNYNTTLPYVQIHNVYSLNIDAYNASEYERYKAEAATDKETKLNHLDAALKAEPLNYKAWNDKLALVASDQTAYQSTLNDMKSALKDYPVIINNLEKDTKQ